MKTERVVAVVACAAILIGALAAAWVASSRAPNADETEYLHTGFLMHDGQRIYRDFFEHHPPFLFQILSTLVPERAPGELPSGTSQRYVRRARAVFIPIGLGAILVAAWLAWRITQWPGAPALVMAVLFVPPSTWGRVVVSVRHDGPALLLFWSGAALLLGRWRDDKRAALASGVGIGLAFLSAVLNPKWPLACLVLGVVYLANVWRGRRVAVYAIVPALLIVAIPFAAVLTATTMREYIAFTFDYSVRLSRWTSAGGLTYGPEPLAFTPAWFKGAYPILAAAIVIVFGKRLDPARRRALLVVLAIAVAAAIEIRFLHSWPNVWTQFLLMWCFSMAILYGAAAGLLRDLLPERARPVIAGTAVLLIAGGSFYALAGRFTNVLPSEVNTSGRWMLDRLRPGETVWMDGVRHPILARDAHYYWFGFNEHIAYLLDAQKRGDAPPYLPRVAEEDLPPCRVVRGIDAHVRFLTSDNDIRGLHGTTRCIDALLASGRAKRPSLPRRGFVEIVR